MNTMKKGIDVQCVREILSRDGRRQLNEFRHVCNKMISGIDDNEVELKIKSLESKYPYKWIRTFLHSSLDVENNFYRSVTWQSFEESYVKLNV